MLGPQGTGHAQIFAKGDSPLAVSRAAISRLQPEGHTNISRSEADLEIRVSEFESTASGGSGALFLTPREQELLSGEKLQDPLQTVKTPVSGVVNARGATPLLGIFSLHCLFRIDGIKGHPKMLRWA